MAVRRRRPLIPPPYPRRNPYTPSSSQSPLGSVPAVSLRLSARATFAPLSLLSHKDLRIFACLRRTGESPHRSARGPASEICFGSASVSSLWRTVFSFLLPGPCRRPVKGSDAAAPSAPWKPAPEPAFWPSFPAYQYSISLPRYVLRSRDISEQGPFRGPLPYYSQVFTNLTSSLDGVTFARTR